MMVNLMLCVLKYNCIKIFKDNFEACENILPQQGKFYLGVISVMYVVCGVHFLFPTAFFQFQAVGLGVSEPLRSL